MAGWTVGSSSPELTATPHSYGKGQISTRVADSTQVLYPGILSAVVPFYAHLHTTVALHAPFSFVGDSNQTSAAESPARLFWSSIFRSYIFSAPSCTNSTSFPVDLFPV